MAALESRAKDIPNLISPHLGGRVSSSDISVVSAVAQVSATTGTAAAGQSTTLAALPLGGRIKMNPWTDDLQMLKSKPVGMVAEREKMPFEVTPFVLYLTRVEVAGGTQNNGAVSADSKAASADEADPTKPQR
jgi:hypothetical protein